MPFVVVLKSAKNEEREDLPNVVQRASSRQKSQRGTVDQKQRTLDGTRLIRGVHRREITRSHIARWGRNTKKMRVAPVGKNMRKAKRESNATLAAKREIGGARSSNAGDDGHSKTRDVSKMSKVESPDIDLLIQQGDWVEARREIERARAADPRNHWLLTQLGVTHYEQGQYKKALSIFVDSISIVPDCPLTLWNLAGAFDAVGDPRIALRIYAWLLMKSKKTAKDDPCWENEQWGEALHADCIYRAGVCLKRLNKPKLADDCFRQYLSVLLDGISGTYSMDDVARQIRANQGASPQYHRKQRRAAIESMLEATPVQSVLGIGKDLRSLSPQELIPERPTG